jgi:hypothetical protein
MRPSDAPASINGIREPVGTAQDLLEALFRAVEQTADGGRDVNEIDVEGSTAPPPSATVGDPGTDP